MTINLFTLANIGNTARNLVKSREESKSNWQKAVDEIAHNKRMESNPLYKKGYNLFSGATKQAEKGVSAVSRAIKPMNDTIEGFTSFIPKKMSGKFFDDEKVFYEKLRGNGYTDKKAKEAIYGRRKEMLGGREYLSNTEHMLVKELQKNGYGSEEIFGVIGVHRQEQEKKRQAEEQARIDAHQAYLADPSKGGIGGVDADFKFHNTFGWLQNAGDAITIKSDKDDGFFESAAKMGVNIPGNLLKIGAGVGNLASTAVQEGVYDTVAGSANQIMKHTSEYADQVDAAYKEAEGRKGWGQGILNATDKVISDAKKFTVENPLDVMTIMKPKDVGTIYKGATKATIETGKFITKPAHPLFNGTAKLTKKYLGTPDEISGMQAAIRPKVTRKGNVIVRSQKQIEQDIRLTNGLIRASGEKPTDLATYKVAVHNEMKKIGAEISRLTGQDLEVDLSATIGKLEDIATSKTTQILDGGDGNKISAIVENLKAYNGKISVADAENMNQWLNDTLKSPTSGASETTKRAYQVLVADIREGLDSAISQIPGQFKEIKKAYGSLRNVYGDIIKREIVYNRKNPTGLIESIGTIEGAGEVVGGFGKIITGNVKTGVSQIGKGLTNNAVGRFIAHKNDPNTIIRNIFAKGGKSLELPKIAENGVRNVKNTVGGNAIVTKSGKIIGLKQYSPHNISVLADNSFKKTGKELVKNNRLSGKGYSFLEAKTGKTFKGTESVNRIQISLRNGKLHIDDGRHLLQAYLELNTPIPGKVVQFTNSAKIFYIKSILESRKNKKSSSSKTNTHQK